MDNWKTASHTSTRERKFILAVEIVNIYLIKKHLEKKFPDVLAVFILFILNPSFIQWRSSKKRIQIIWLSLLSSGFPTIY